MKRFGSILLFVILNAGTVAVLHAQNRSDDDAFLTPGARTTAMGGATLADAHDLSIAFANPAGLMFLQEISLLMDHGRQAGNPAKSGTVGIMFDEGEGGRLAIAATLAYDALFNTTDNAVLSRRVGFDAAQAIWITSTIGFGVSASFQYSKTRELQHLRLNSVIGLQYSPAPEISYAVTLKGIGTTVVAAPHSSPIQYGPLPKELTMGLAMRFPSSYDHQVFTLAVGNSKQFGLPGLTYNAGAELCPVPFLALRVGYITRPGASGVTFGSGVYIGSFEFDWGVSTAQVTHVYQASVLARF